MFNIVKYNSSHLSEWNEFVQCARNATFLHERGYMDYHADRFVDESLLVYHDKKLCALFPANGDGDTVYSHRGLTYGGLILSHCVHLVDVAEILSNIRDHYKSLGYNNIVIRCLPYIYNTYCCDDFLYWLRRHNAAITDYNLSSCVDLTCPLPFSTLRRRHARRALSNNLRIREFVSDMQISSATPESWKAYWKVLTDVLQEHHGCSPVHSLDEIMLLRSRFPNNILLFTVENAEGKVIAGTVLYVCKQVVHVQYIASNNEGRSTGALDLLFQRLIEHFSAQYVHHSTPLLSLDTPRYFDFGYSTEDGGRYLNEGLLFQKEGYGARSVVYDVYTLHLS